MHALVFLLLFGFRHGTMGFRTLVRWPKFRGTMKWYDSFHIKWYAEFIGLIRLYIRIYRPQKYNAVLGITMQQITSNLPLSEELKVALCSNQGEMGKLLLALKMIEKNKHEECDKNSLKQLNSTYWQGLRWADELMDSISK